MGAKHNRSRAFFGPISKCKLKVASSGSENVKIPLALNLFSLHSASSMEAVVFVKRLWMNLLDRLVIDLLSDGCSKIASLSIHG